MNSRSKAEATGSKILQAALELFREEGFDGTTMRQIADKAQMAVGAAYYYYPSKDAIVLDYYQRSCDEMQEKLEDALQSTESFEAGLCALIRVKLVQFEPNRSVLRALLRNGADPTYPLSPFSAETRQIRELDVSWFQRLVEQSGIRIPRDLKPHLPTVLWFMQMGLIYFWVTDDSPQQRRTDRILPLACKVAATLVRFSALPFMRPLRKPILEVIAIARGA
jgi:AcrR family transcriptional regulator